MALTIISATDVIRRIGGQSVLVQLLPSSTDSSTYDSDSLSALMSDSMEFIASRANVQVDVQALQRAVTLGTATWPPELVNICAWYAVGMVWDAGSSGMAKPPHVQDWQTRILDVECERLRKREISLGAPTQYPGTNQLYTRVDADPDQNRMQRNAFRVRGGFG